MENCLSMSLSESPKVCTTSCQTTPGVAMTTSLILIVQVSNQFTVGGLYRWSCVTPNKCFLLVVTMACKLCTVSYDHLYKLAG